MPYIFGKLWHLAIIWAIRKAFQCILQGVRFLLANHTRLSPTSENESFPLLNHILSYFTASKRSRPGGATCYSQGILKQFHSPTKFPEKRIHGICLVEYSRNIFTSNFCLFCQLHCIHARSIKGPFKKVLLLLLS